jgi:hypothetical protein
MTTESQNNVKMICGFCRAEFTPEMKADIEMATDYDTCLCEDGCCGGHSSDHVEELKITIKCSNCDRVVYIKELEKYADF